MAPSETVGPGHHAALAAGRLWPLGAVKTLPLSVPKDDRSATPTRPMDEVFPTVAVQIGPRQPGSLSAQTSRNQRLDERIIEGFAGRSGPQQRADVFEERLRLGSRRRRGFWRVSGLGDLIPVVGLRPFDAADRTAAPPDLQYRRGVCGGRGRSGEDPQGLVAREVPTTGGYLLALREGRRDEPNLGSDARRVGGLAAEFNGDAFVDFFDYDEFVAAFEVGCG